MVHPKGKDANIRCALLNADKYETFEIERLNDQIVFRCNGKVRKTASSSGRTRGDDATRELMGAKLQPGFTIAKGDRASFRNARIFK